MHLYFFQTSSLNIFIFKIVILTIVAFCWAGELEFGGHGLTLGEIAVDHEEEGFGLGELGSVDV